VGGIFSSHLVEHLPSEMLPHMLAGIERALPVGGVAVIATPNPATVATHLQSCWPDPVHTHPVSARSLSFAARGAGLVVENIVYGSPSAEGDRLKSVDESALATADEAEQALASAFNAAIGQLNELLYGYQDYALVMRKQPVDNAPNARAGAPAQVDVGVAAPGAGSGISLERPAP
jgi:O-antigen chain-terminating methyltransferase